MEKLNGIIIRKVLTEPTYPDTQADISDILATQVIHN